MTEVRLNIDDEFIYSASEVICCRICHEAEFESCKSLETPCSCSGTVKFAHRDCVQRWCDEKGNTICEICLQNFEPGYTAPPPKKASQDTHVTIRESVEASRTDENLVIIAIADEEEENLIEREYAECSSTADATASMCRTLALIFTILLLVRHFIGVLIGETGNYPFTLLTLLLIKACGILLPMYIIMRVIDVVHNSITRQYQDSERDNI
ncbi:putative E3 ubiquitin-protein ligase MARCH [Helianthus annuus]|nr:putative E3 ubiquitin-protein ligase MARCH [Helianthus annuus]KAJ0597731.1 putative E3 ubiquitin-protein ligase MARCH [Helianthus annuus]KAJ0758374.1 putative E3 ubiquitin-protein ligase MARCH [Helianthus annuus]KAJ0797211.1 putative E3 ubiquitin-protein ligase MARCH [Helianthus annuus]